MFRTMAHRPEIFETIIAHMEAVLTTDTLPEALKELVIVRTSQLKRAPYCLASHTTIARKLGWTEEQMRLFIVQETTRNSANGRRKRFISLRS